MDPKQWTGKSVESEVFLDPAVIQRGRDDIRKERLAIESGDTLNLYDHWLFPAGTLPFQDELSELVQESYSITWKSGRIDYRKPLHAGDTYNRTVQVQKVDEIQGEMTSYLVRTGIKIRQGHDLLLEEEQDLLLTKNLEQHHDLRRINFEGDWKLNVDSDERKITGSLQSTFFGHPVSDSVALTGQKDDSGITIQGSPSVILLMRSFTEHFESRKADRLSYAIHGISEENELVISGKDTDAFVTSLRLINSKRQVLVGLDVRWSYNW
jgi:hydroxyacyl-ACP dehydratase HTD2-like protein with hotdog domain